MNGIGLGANMIARKQGCATEPAAVHLPLGRFCDWLGREEHPPKNLLSSPLFWRSGVLAVNPLSAELRCGRALAEVDPDACAARLFGFEGDAAAVRFDDLSRDG